MIPDLTRQTEIRIFRFPKKAAARRDFSKAPASRTRMFANRFYSRPTREHQPTPLFLRRAFCVHLTSFLCSSIIGVSLEEKIIGRIRLAKGAY
jgi:hypothetical protein